MSGSWAVLEKRVMSLLQRYPAPPRHKHTSAGWQGERGVSLRQPQGLGGQKAFSFPDTDTRGAVCSAWGQHGGSNPNSVGSAVDAKMCCSGAQ